jgi:hypothetical protein
MNGTDLPIIIIDTKGAEILDDPKITANMKIIARNDGRLNYLNDNPTVYSGKIGIETRGQSSQYYFPKKSYGIELRTEAGLDTSVSLLNLPAESDWVLYSPYTDKTLIRNALIYELGNRTGQWAPHTRFCEVVLNGEYWGIYLLIEKIKRSKGRVNISKLKKTDISGSDMTGGYILKIDKGFSSNIGFTSRYTSATNSAINFEYVYPKPDSIQAQQVGYITSFMSNFESALKGSNFKDPVTGFRQFANDTSFVDYYMINEFAKNVDGYRISSFMYKNRTDKGGKLTMGPLWDYDITLGNVNYYQGWTTYGWALDKLDNWDEFQAPFWWKRLLQDEEYVKLLRKRWDKNRATFMSDNELMNMVDSISAIPSAALDRNFERWPVFGEYIWPNYYVGNNYNDEIEYLKDWIVERTAWLDDNIPGKTLTEIDETQRNIETLNVYPNPFISWVEVNSTSSLAGVYTIEILNAQGKVIDHQTKNYAANSLINWKIDFKQNITSGIYIVKLIHPDGLIETGKIVKN